MLILLDCALLLKLPEEHSLRSIHLQRAFPALVIKKVTFWDSLPLEKTVEMSCFTYFNTQCPEHIRNI